MRKTTVFAIASILISVVVHFRWFTGFDVLTAGDWGVAFRDEVLPRLALPLAWRPDDLGSFFLNAPFWPMLFIHAALSWLGLSYGVIERVEYLWPIVVLTPLGAFLLTRKLTRSDLAAFIASLAWANNVAFFTRQRAHIYIMLADAIIPFAVLAYIRCLETRRMRDVVVAGLVLFAVSAADFRLFYALAFVLAGWFVLDLICARAWRDREGAVRRVIAGIMPLAIVLLLNAYWIIGFTAAGVLTHNRILDRDIFGDYLTDTAEALALWSGGWTDGAPVLFGTEPVMPRFWWLPLAALGGFWVRRRNKEAVFFGLVALLGVFLGKQADAPFTDAYRWLFEHFPGFKAFRESSKFFVLIALGYAMLVGYLVAWLETSARGVLRKLRVPIFAALIILPLWNAVPLLTGEIGAIFIPAVQPQGYEPFNAFLHDRQDFFRVLWVPSKPAWALTSPTHPSIGTATLHSVRMGTMSSDMPPGDEGPAGLKDLFSDPRAEELLGRLSVRYVAIPPRMNSQNDWAFKLYGTDRDEAIRILDEVPFLHRIDIGTGDLIVYENAGARPHYYIVDAAGAEFLPTAFRPIQSASADLSRRLLTIRDIRGPFSLTFTDSFHPGWQLAPHAPNPVSVLLGWDPAVPGVVHASDAAGLNVFRVDPDVACAIVECQRGADGSLTMQATLFFRPQAYFDLGSAVTILTLVACVGYLGSTALAHRRKSPRNV